MEEQPKKFDRNSIKERLLGIQKRKFLVDIKDLKNEIVSLEQKFKKFLFKYGCDNLFDLKPLVPHDIYEKAEDIKKELEKKKIDLAYIQEQGRKVKRELRVTSNKIFPEHHENLEKKD